MLGSIFSGRAMTRTRAGFVLAFVFGLVGAAPALATFPGLNGEISYTAGYFALGPSNGYEEYTNLFVTSPDGTKVRQLTTGRQQDLGGFWSPDSSRMVFSRPRPPGSGATRQTMLISAEGGPTLDVLDTNCFECRFGSWTPDGLRFVSAAHFGGVTGVYSMAPDGSDPQLIVAAPVGENVLDTVISPDGTKVAYVRVTSNFPHPAILMVANIDGSGAHRIAYGMSPDWSPDSTRLAYSTDSPDDGPPRPPNRIMVSDVAGVVRVPIAPIDLYENYPSWSPDGSEIAFSAVSFSFVSYMLVARAPVGGVGQPPGADSPGCVRGYRALLKGVIQDVHWGSHHPASGIAAHPAAVPCPAAPASQAANAPSALLSTALAPRRGRLRVRVRLAKGAKGRLVVKATMRHRALKRTGRAGKGRRRTYAFVVRRAGTATVTIRFVGRAGWASTRLPKKRVRVRPKASHG